MWFFVGLDGVLTLLCLRQTKTQKYSSWSSWTLNCIEIGSQLLWGYLECQGNQNMHQQSLIFINLIVFQQCNCIFWVSEHQNMHQQSLIFINLIVFQQCNCIFWVSEHLHTKRRRDAGGQWCCWSCGLSCWTDRQDQRMQGCWLVTILLIASVANASRATNTSYPAH